MKRSLRMSGILLAVLSFGQVTHARFINLSEMVPVERLVQNLSRFVQENPKDAEGYYVLGRIHSLAFAREAESVEVIPAEKKRGGNNRLPGFAPYDSVRVNRENPDKPLSDAGLKHLHESVRLYAKAVELAPKDGLYWLGYGWMLEQGIGHAPKLKPAEKSSDWQAKSLEAYRKSFALTAESDAKKGGYLNAGDALVSREAGEGSLRLLGKKEQSAAEKTEIATIKDHLVKLEKMPMAVTPLIVPLGENTSFAAQMASEKIVKFDLLGDGRATRWPWVSKNTGILVWDPSRNGKITSGRQLFGSVTWWIFWKDGYQALASLDDNGDGWLRGEELNGISIWRDANSNAVSESGEVRPVGEHGIAALSVRGAWQNGVLMSANGCELQDGTRRATYDWMPQEIIAR
jgi:hypothetical protein